jgi:hypothetical protein
MTSFATWVRKYARLSALIVSIACAMSREPWLFVRFDYSEV